MLPNGTEAVFEKQDAGLVEFARDLVRTRSYSDQEGDLANLVAGKMRELGYDEVVIDSTGNVAGRIGNGPKCILFDSHMDTVEVNDEGEWSVPPFSGEIRDGRIWGRGTADMKSSLAASVFAGAIA